MSHAHAHTYAHAHAHHHHHAKTKTLEEALESLKNGRVAVEWTNTREYRSYLPPSVGSPIKVKTIIDFMQNPAIKDKAAKVFWYICSAYDIPLIHVSTFPPKMKEYGSIPFKTMTIALGDGPDMNQTEFNEKASDPAWVEDFIHELDRIQLSESEWNAIPTGGTTHAVERKLEEKKGIFIKLNPEDIWRQQKATWAMIGGITAGLVGGAGLVLGGTYFFSRMR